MQESNLNSFNNNNNDNDTSRSIINKENQKIYKLSFRKKNLSDNSPELTKLSELNPDNILLLNLSHNNLTFLPENLLTLKNLISLDLRKNAFKDMNNIIDFLSKYKYLTDLKIDFSSSSQVQTLLKKIPNLLFINNKSTEEYINPIDINKDILEEISIEKQLNEFNDLFVIFQNNFQNENKDDLSKDLYERFQNLINNEANKINESNNGKNLKNFCLANNIIKSEVNLISFFLNSFFEHSELLNMENAKKDISKKINDILNLLFNTLIKIIEELNTKIDSANKLKNKNIELLLEYLNDNHKNENTKIYEEYENLQKQFKKDRELYILKIDKLQKENKLITESLIKKGIDLSSSINNINLNNSNISKKSGDENIGIDATFLGLAGAKILTKKQMKDFINEIYDSKMEYDKVCSENHLKKESMEHYMYKFLNNKYGLKNLVIEWSSSIITGIKMYSSSDSDINLFNKILKNKIEEGQKLVIIKLKSTIKELYDMYIKNKSRLNSNKGKNKLNEAEIEYILNSFNENILLNEDEWKNIIKSIYNEEEYKILIKYIINKISDKNDIEKKKLHKKFNVKKEIRSYKG